MKIDDARRRAAPQKGAVGSAAKPNLVCARDVIRARVLKTRRMQQGGFVRHRAGNISQAKADDPSRKRGNA
jgi:hypothetical protein